MKKITKILALATASSCLLFASATMASDKGTSTPLIKQVKKGTPVSLLFAFESQNGSLKHIKGNSYEFSFPVNKDDKVLVFSNRPYRIAYTMPRKKWVKMVMEQEDSFRDNPPNIALTWADPKVAVAAYTIVRQGFVNGRVVYTLHAVGPVHQPEEIGGFVGVYVDTATNIPAPGTGVPWGWG